MIRGFGEALVGRLELFLSILLVLATGFDSASQDVALVLADRLHGAVVGGRAAAGGEQAENDDDPEAEDGSQRASEIA